MGQGWKNLIVNLLRSNVGWVVLTLQIKSEVLTGLDTHTFDSIRL